MGVPMTISRNGFSPLYVQIRQSIEQDLREKRLLPGQSLPSEDDLAVRFEVNRLTVRRAIDQLVSQGKLKRVQGRGTFVAEPTGETKSSGVTRWSVERSSSGINITRRVTQVMEGEPTVRVANLLHMLPRETVVELTIDVEADGSPLGCTVVRIPKLLVPDVQAWELGGSSLSGFLTERCGLEFGKVTERVRSVLAEEDIAEKLRLEPGAPLLYVDSLIHLASGIPAVLSDTYYRGDAYTYRGLLRPLDDI